MQAQMEASWLELLHSEFSQPYIKQLERFLAGEYQSNKAIYPPSSLIFSAFCQFPLSELKVVIIGQDPYHGPNQAHGLSFSVPEGVALPPSLRNIYQELHDDLGLPIPKTGSLLSWAKQGVLLLNSVLTVRENEAGSHCGRGWEMFTDRVVECLANLPNPLAFVLWGRYAMAKWQPFEGKSNRHLILKAPHPSPFSARTGFFGSKPFSQVNAFLKSIGKDPIDWNVYGTQ